EWSLSRTCGRAYRGYPRTRMVHGPGMYHDRSRRISGQHCGPRFSQGIRVMDQKERSGNFQAVVRAAIRNQLANLWTALPGIVHTVDLAKMTVTVQPSIKVRVRASDGTL